MRHRVLTAACFGLFGCGLLCPPAPKCASEGAIVIRVFDAETQAALADATVLAASDGSTALEVAPCQFDRRASGPPDGGAMNCRAIPSPGKYHLTVKANGYVETSLDVEAMRDACGHGSTQNRDVQLPKLGTAKQALVESSESCGG